jgi:hypothetical protein
MYGLSSASSAENRCQVHPGLFFSDKGIQPLAVKIP